MFLDLEPSNPMLKCLLTSFNVKNETLSRGKKHAPEISKMSLTQFEIPLELQCNQYYLLKKFPRSGFGDTFKLISVRAHNVPEPLITLLKS